tara:strand:- start:9822 stop:10034 length:213 start_codon:yes stop_codon:yes gene_type:complete
MKIKDLLPAGFGSKSDVVKAQYIDALIAKVTIMARALRDKRAAITSEEATAQMDKITAAASEDIIVVEED